VAKPNAYTVVMRMIDIDQYSVDERLRLLEEIWDSLTETPESIPLSQAHRTELDRRISDLYRTGPVGIPWQEVLDRIRG
jgi:putative addiction module component (TIGR02574 family)